VNQKTNKSSLQVIHLNLVKVVVDSTEVEVGLVDLGETVTIVMIVAEGERYHNRSQDNQQYLHAIIATVKATSLSTAPPSLHPKLMQLRQLLTSF
jgi:hypothetical protein